MSVPKRSAVLMSVIMMAVALLSPTVCAQTTGTIYGQVTDASDAVVAGATVKGRNLGTTLVRSAVTNSEGSYLIPSLPPGSYEVTVELAGFKTFVQSGITLQVGENVRIDTALQVGEVTQKISVESEALRVDTHSTTLGTTVDNRRLNKIPLNGRNVYSLALLVPGVGPGANIQAAQPNGVDGVTLSVSGNRDESNNILLDGTGMLFAWINVGVNLPNPDALQEFRILTNTFSAEYGRAAGGVFIAVTKSGTNEIHGSLYEFLRNDNLNASNFFTPGRVPKLAQNQFGGTVGGPLIKNKTFLFGSYQGTRIRQENITSYFPPSAAERRGDFSASGKTIRDPDTGLPFPGNIIPQARFDPLTLKFMNEFIELPNLPDGRYQELFGTPTNGNEFTIKGDHQLTSADRLSLRYYRKRDEGFNQGSAVLKLSGSRFTTINTGVLNATHVFNPGLLAEYRVSFIHTSPNFALNPAARKTPRDLGGNYNYDGPIPTPPSFNIAGRVGASPLRSIEFPDDAWEVAGKLSWIHGRHAIKFGTEIRRLHHATRVHEWGGAATFDGLFSGDAAADYLLGRTSSLGLRPFGGDYTSSRQWQFFVQDDFKVNRHLTLNFGLRNEIFEPWVQENGEVAIFRPGQQSTLYKTAPPGLVYPPDPLRKLPGDPGVPKGLYRTEKNNFAPRFGIAWDPFGNGRTSIRAAYGIFTVTTPSVLVGQLGQNAQPYRLTFNVPSPARVSDPYADGRPDPFPFDPNTARTNPRFEFPLADQHYLDPDFHNGYVQQYNLNIQHQFGADLFVQAGYVGNVGRKLMIFREFNSAIYGPGASSANIQARRPYFPQFYTVISQESTDANSSYNSLQVNVEKSFSHGYTMQLAYTYSKTLDQDSTGLAFGNFRNNTFGPQDNDNLRAEWGPAGFHQKHVLAVNGIWEVPFLKDRGAISTIFGEWQLSGTTRVTSGLAYTPLMGADTRFRGGFRNQDRPDVVGNAVLDSNRPRGEQVAQYFNTKAYIANSGPGREGLGGSASRGQIVGPGFSQTDLAVLKRFPLKERHRIEFRAEFFNLFNQVNLGPPNTTFVSPAFGRITSAREPRIVQFGLRWDF